MSKLNLPNKLTVLRFCLVPIFMVVMMLPINDTASRVISAFLFIITALTDMLDGKIARKHNLITDFGKFMDPLADKFMVFGAMLAILAKYHNDDTFRITFMIAASIVILRELAVTSIRLVANNATGVVIAASILGKIKTVTQIVCISTILLEPVIVGGLLGLAGISYPVPVLTYLTMAAMTVMTLWSGIDYIKAYWGYLDPTK